MANRASDDLLLQLIREGKHDSEIAVRLGVSTGELRERKQDLRNRLGDDKYYAATTPRATGPKKRGKGRYFAYGAALAVGALAVLLVVANIVVDDPGDEEAARAAAPLLSPTARPQVQLKAPAGLSLEGVEYDDAGTFLTVAGAKTPDFQSLENRPGLVQVKFAETGFVSASEFAAWEVFATSRNVYRMRSKLGERTVEVRVSAADQVTQLRDLAKGIGPVVEASSQFEAYRPTIRIRVYAEDGQQLQARVTEDGRLLVAKAPIPTTWVLDRDTGVRLKTEGALSLGKLQISLGSTSVSTVCSMLSSEPRCSVTWFRSNRLLTDVEGAVTCVGPSSLRFEAAGVRLGISKRTVPANDPPLQCEPFIAPAGSRIVPDGDWEIRATTLDGADLSVGVTSDGTLLVGEFTR